MTNYETMKKSNREWYSRPFYSHPKGYKLCLRVIANGDDGEGTHISVLAYLMRGKFDQLTWPFRGHVVIQLCNQLQDKYHHGYTIPFSQTTNEKVISQVTDGNIAKCGEGYSTYISHNDLNFNPTNNCQYLKNDCRFLSN